ncbi:MAG: GTP-binding protein [Candidatus Korarchaeota archaeon]
MASSVSYIFKTIVVGKGASGKTSLMMRWTEGKFREDYLMTIGVNFNVKDIDLLTFDGKRERVRLTIWDTAGQERFAKIRPTYYNGAMGGLLVFDLTSRDSFDELEMWVEEIKKYIAGIPLILVGNKIDLPNRAVSTKEALIKARELGKLYYENDIPLYYYETSAKTGANVNSVFKDLARLMISASG